MAATTEVVAGAASTTDGTTDTTGGTDTTKTAATTTTTTEKKAEDQGKEPASKDDAASQQSKAPEKYNLTLPDGGRIDARDLTTIEAVARAQGWTNEETQQRVNAHAEAITAQSTRFLEETKADATYGGAKLDETRKFALAALDHFRPKGSPRGDGLRALLDKSGYGNHLEVLSLLTDIGKAMAEDGTTGGLGGGGGDSADPATAIYGTGPQVKS